MGVVRSRGGGSGDKNPAGSARKEVRRTKKKNICWTLEYERTRSGTKRDQYELRVATKHLLHCFQVPEVRVCARETFPARGAVQHIKGDGEECERIQGGSQRVDRGSGVGGAPEEGPAVNGQARCHFLLQVSSWHQVQ